MYNIAIDGMNDETVLRIYLQITLGEFLIDEGFDLTGSSSWEVRVWTGVPNKSVVVAIIAQTYSGTWSFCPMAGANRKSCRVPWADPFEVMVKLLREIHELVPNLEHVPASLDP